MRLVVLSLMSIGLVGLSAFGGSTDPEALESAQQPTSKSAESNATKNKSQERGKSSAKARRFTFHYRFRVKGLTQATNPDEAAVVRVWIPCPSNSDYQQVKRLDATTPGKLSENIEPLYGNRILYFQTPVPDTGEFVVDIPYVVVRHEVLRTERDPVKAPVEGLDARQRARLLSADRLIPTTGKPLKLLDPLMLRQDKLQLARQLYDLVDDHVAYKKEGTGWGKGDTNWVCDSGYGNCTDFHSLFISLARSQGLPARFEIGFSIPTDKRAGPVAGYHCWAWFYLDGQGWMPVDISEADKAPQLKDYYFGNLTADRVTFSVGRDLKLVPGSDNEPLNFFVFPFVEVRGKVLSSDNIEVQNGFEEM